MPLWTIHHSSGCLTGQDRQELASGISDLYTMLPRFYVGVVFHEAEENGLFVGGVERDRFVRIWVDQFARTTTDSTRRTWWIENVNDYIAPFMSERSLDWELHIGETSPELWLIQGMRPPGPGSPGEKLWKEQNEPVPLGAATPLQ